MKKWVNDQKGFFLVDFGFSFPVVMILSVTCGFLFLSFFKMMIFDQAKSETEYQVNLVMQSVERDAWSAYGYSLMRGGELLALWHYPTENDSTKCSVYEWKEDSSVIYRNSQPLTGQNTFHDVKISDFKASVSKKGILRISLTGISPVSGYRYTQVTELALEEKHGAPKQ